MRTLIINLTRFGDLLQTQSVIHELKNEGHTVGVVCLDAFGEAARLLDGVDMLIPLPGSDLLHTLDQDWRLAVGMVQHWTEKLNAGFQPDQVINLTASLGARLLARALVCRTGIPLHCFGVDAHGFGTNSTLWTSFFEASTRQRGCSPYNIVDVFRKAAGLAHHTPKHPPGLRRPDPTVLKQASLMLQNEIEGLELAQKPKGLIAFQPGASEERRQWPVEHFAHLGNLLAADGYIPVLLGSKNERPLAQAYDLAMVRDAGAGHTPVRIDLIGRTSLPLLASVLLQSTLLVTNDTGTLHLAAGLGVPSVSLFFATAQPWDTGPYLEDCCCLEPALDCHPCGFGTTCPHNTRCRASISAHTVYTLIRTRLEHAPGDLGPSWGVWPTLRHEARIWQSGFNGSNHDSMDLTSLSDHEGDPRTVWIRLQRHFYRQFLDLADSADFRDSGDVRFTPPPPELAASLPAEDNIALVATLHEAEALLLLLENLGILLQTAYSARRGEQFLATAHRLTALFDASTAFNALGRLWLTASQERGGNLTQVLRLISALGQLVRAWKTCLSEEAPEGLAP